MCDAKSIPHNEIDFKSPKLKQAYKVVERDISIIAHKFCESLERFTDAFQNGEVLIGIYNTPCGKSCIFVEHNQSQLIAPLRELH